MKRRILALLMATMMVVALVACGNTSKTDGEKDIKDLEKVTFVLDWTPNTNHTGLYVAQEKGYFEAAGIRVEIVQPPEDGAEVLVASGKADFGVSFQDTMAPALVGDDALPITAVAAVLQHNTSGIISRKGEGMNTPKGMEGRTYATWNSPVELATLKQVVEKDGGDFSKVELYYGSIDNEVAALRTDTVDSIWIFYGWAGVKMELEELETDYFAFADIDAVFDYYTPVIIAGNKFLEEKPEVAKAFLGAVSKGYEYAIAHPEEAAEILCGSNPELDEELVKESQKYLAEEYQAEAKQWGYIDATRWNNFYHWLNENDLVEMNIPENTGFSNAYLPE